MYPVNYITEINERENINLQKIVKLFEKKIKKCFGRYNDNIGLEDYKMNEYDYIVLYTLWKYSGQLHCIEEYLIIMYSYYKLEEFYFPIKLFKADKCIEMLSDPMISLILDNLVKF